MKYQPIFPKNSEKLRGILEISDCCHIFMFNLYLISKPYYDKLQGTEMDPLNGKKWMTELSIHLRACLWLHWHLFHQTWINYLIFISWEAENSCRGINANFETFRNNGVLLLKAFRHEGKSTDLIFVTYHLTKEVEKLTMGHLWNLHHVFSLLEINGYLGYQRSTKSIC